MTDIFRKMRKPDFYKSLFVSLLAYSDTLTPAVLLYAEKPFTVQANATR